MTSISADTVEQLTAQTSERLLDLAKKLEFGVQDNLPIAGFQIDFPENGGLNLFTLTFITQSHCFELILRPNNEMLIYTLNYQTEELFAQIRDELNSPLLYGAPLTPGPTIMHTYEGVSRGAISNLNVDTLFVLAEAYRSLLLKEQFVPVAIGILPRLKSIATLIKNRIDLEVAKE